MIVGNGLIATTFSNSPFNWDDYVVFASGVSNSKEERKSEYQREIDLINSFLGTEKRFIYFSTVSIFDEELSETAYVKHKIATEKFVLASFKKSLIIRLPIVVSEHNNPNQLLGFLKSTIESGKEVTIYKNAARYFFDANKLPTAVDCCARYAEVNGKANWALNLGLPDQVMLTSVARLIKEELGYKKVMEVNKGNAYAIDFSEYENIAKRYCEKTASESALQLVRSKILLFKKK